MTKIYDLEVLKNYFLYMDLDLIEDEFQIFEISLLQNDLSALIEYLKNVKGQIGFNNLNYDSQIQQFILNNHKKWKDLSGEEIAEKIYEYSQSVISNSDNNEWPEFSEKKLSIKQLDLFRIWHYNNRARSCSVKWLQYSMDWYNIEDMPISHYTKITDRETADLIIDYCKNDCLSTREFYKITKGDTNHTLYKGIDKIQLRKDVSKEFGFNCLNYDDVKIGDRIIKTIYADLSNTDIFDIPKKGTFRSSIKVKDCIGNDFKFKSPELIKFYEDFVNSSFAPITVKTEKKWYFKFEHLTISLGYGGLHTENKPAIFLTDDKGYLTDKDCTGMYPRTIIERKLYPKHLGPKWYEGCKYIYDKRTNEYKPQAETDKRAQSFSEAFKLASNGGSFGKTNEPNSWQYDPLVTFSITLYNQLALLKLTEELILAGINVLVLNTDGLMSYVRFEQKDLYESICKKWEELTHHILEETLYKKYVQLTVNDYIAIKMNDKPKEKGDFMVDYELHKNKSFRVIPLALGQYYRFGIRPEKFILDHRNIFDFCAGIRAKRGWWFESRYFTGGELIIDKLQKTVRYYISKGGSKLMKCHEDGRELQVNAGNYPSIIYNKHIEKPDYKIDYNYYIDKVYEIINKIEPHIVSKEYTQMSLF